jgi:adenine-specific DNA-methyltransferase
MNEMIKRGVVQFRDTHNDPPIRKTYLVRSNILPNDELDDLDKDDIGAQVMGSYFYRSALQASNTLLKIFGEKRFENPKDYEVLSRLIRYVTKNDKSALILDSFAGSGTTAHAVLNQNAEDGGKRRFILVEMDAQIASTITAERLKRVALGYTYNDQKGNEVSEPGLGSGFRFCELGAPLFDPTGPIRPEVKYEDLAQHVHFIETGSPLPRVEKPQYPLLGINNGLAIYLLYNGVLKDKSPHGGNVLTYELLETLPPHDGLKVIYGNGCRIGDQRLRDLGIVFKQIPYEIRER